MEIRSSASAVLRGAKTAWLVVARVLTNALGRFVLLAIYWTLFVPFALTVRWRTRPLEAVCREGSFWKHAETHSRTMQESLKSY